MVFHMLKSIVGTKVKAQHKGPNLRIKWMTEIIRAAFRMKTNAKQLFFLVLYTETT
ncbi:hypothetical protein GMA19_03234 [Paenibacillus polymyxa E681]|nr:hypothetical protein PPE_06085 [Paenibacillus polymyxa E681]QNV58061.1 hypothetical protein GE561_03234 [Paenibacillus polymyxa E681]QNV62898.1 hypothetical protein GMA19_03234 [Paenibacillus polymyxa E681]